MFSTMLEFLGCVLFPDTIWSSIFLLLATYLTICGTAIHIGWKHIPFTYLFAICISGIFVHIGFNSFWRFLGSSIGLFGLAYVASRLPNNYFLKTCSIIYQTLQICWAWFMKGQAKIGGQQEEIDKLREKLARRDEEIAQRDEELAERHTPEEVQELFDIISDRQSKIADAERERDEAIRTSAHRDQLWRDLKYGDVIDNQRAQIAEHQEAEKSLKAKVEELKDELHYQGRDLGAANSKIKKFEEAAPGIHIKCKQDFRELSDENDKLVKENENLQIRVEQFSDVIEVLCRMSETTDPKDYRVRAVAVLSVASMKKAGLDLRAMNIDDDKFGRLLRFVEAGGYETALVQPQGGFRISPSTNDLFCTWISRNPPPVKVCCGGCAQCNPNRPASMVYQPVRQHDYACSTGSIDSRGLGSHTSLASTGLFNTLRNSAGASCDPANSSQTSLGTSSGQQQQQPQASDPSVSTNPWTFLKTSQENNNSAQDPNASQYQTNQNNNGTSQTASGSQAAGQTGANGATGSADNSSNDNLNATQQQNQNTFQAIMDAKRARDQAAQAASGQIQRQAAGASDAMDTSGGASQTQSSQGNATGQTASSGLFSSLSASSTTNPFASSAPSGGGSGAPNPFAYVAASGSSGTSNLSGTPATSSTSNIFGGAATSSTSNTFEGAATGMPSGASNPFASSTASGSSVASTLFGHPAFASSASSGPSNPFSTSQTSAGSGSGSGSCSGLFGTSTNTTPLGQNTNDMLNRMKQQVQNSTGSASGVTGGQTTSSGITSSGPSGLWNLGSSGGQTSSSGTGFGLGASQWGTGTGTGNGAGFGTGTGNGTTSGQWQSGRQWR